MTTSESTGGSPAYDPVFLHARREAIVIVILFSIMCIWSLCVSIGMGYFSDEDAIEISRVMGIPSWVFWGILVPWLVVDLIAIWFCFFFMKDDDLGEVKESPCDSFQHEPQEQHPTAEQS